MRPKNLYPVVLTSYSEKCRVGRLIEGPEGVKLELDFLFLDW
jgi:hypothetical protein